jgi:hypothetical protein
MIPNSEKKKKKKKETTLNTQNKGNHKSFQSLSRKIREKKNNKVVSPAS